MLYRAKYDINDEISPSGKTYTNTHNNRFITKGTSRIESTHSSQYGKWDRMYFLYVFLILLCSFLSLYEYNVGTRPYGLGGRERERSCFNYIFYGETSLPHSPTHSTIQYIITRPSPCTQRPPKYHICSMKKTYLNPESGV